MTRLGMLLAALAIPTVAWAGGGAGRPTMVDVPVMTVRMVPVPVAWMAMPAALAVPSPATVFRDVVRMQDAMRAQMAALQRIVLHGPDLAMPATGNGAMQISMVSLGKPGGFCEQEMRILPRPDGKARVILRYRGNACGPMPVHPALAMPGLAPPQIAPKRPANALPPPSKLIYASYRRPSGVKPEVQRG